MPASAQLGRREPGSVGVVFAPLVHEHGHLIGELLGRRPPCRGTVSPARSLARSHRTGAGRRSGNRHRGAPRTTTRTAGNERPRDRAAPLMGRRHRCRARGFEDVAISRRPVTLPLCSRRRSRRWSDRRRAPEVRGCDPGRTCPRRPDSDGQDDRLPDRHRVRSGDAMVSWARRGITSDTTIPPRPRFRRLRAPRAAVLNIRCGPRAELRICSACCCPNPRPARSTGRFRLRVPDRARSTGTRRRLPSTTAA